jgi:polar amino acid transport system substrate-binding protein
MKKLYAFNLLSCLLLMLTACSESSDVNRVEVQKAETESGVVTSECHLSMGWDPWAPYQYITPEDEVKGLEIDLIDAMAREAGCDISFVQDNWMNLLDGIRDGRIDMLGGATKTKPRENYAIFSDNYRDESFHLYVRSDDIEKFAGKSLKELLEGEFKLGITEDYVYGDLVSVLLDDESFSTKLLAVPISEVNYYNLIQNEIDGFLEDPIVAAYMIRSKGLQGQIESESLDIHSGDVAIMFSRKRVQAETVQAFNKALVKIKESGEYQKILDKYSHLR